MRVVFDTNIFVSALVIPGGRADDAMQRVIEETDQLILSRAIIHELLTVLSRKFDRDKEELARVAVYLFEIGERVEPKKQISVLEDEADNRILECAIAGKADVIVTGDRAMLRLGEYEGIKIINLSQYLQTT
ncbi:MAG: putative toxin-antitoxin system toxin component, PIN family [bacterium]